MSRLFTCGFELQSNVNGVEATTFGGTTSVNTTIKRSGSASLRCNPAGANGYVQHNVAIWPNAYNVVYSRVCVYIASAPSVITSILNHVGTNTPQSAIRLNTSRQLELWNWAVSAKLGSSSAVLNLNQWYTIELYTNALAGNGTSTARLDGVQFATSTSSSATGQVDVVNVGVIDTATADIYLDDIAVNNNVGTVQNSWPGLASLAYLRPNGDGFHNTGWATITGSATRWGAVDELTPDEDTTYVYTPTMNDVVDFTVAASGIATGSTISMVSVYNRLKSLDPVASTTQPHLRTGGTDYFGATADSVSNNTNYLNSFAVWATNPFTAAAWTVSGIDGLNIGAKKINSAGQRLTTVWEIVEYTAATATLIAVSDVNGAASEALQINVNPAISDGGSATLEALALLSQFPLLDLGLGSEIPSISSPVAISDLGSLTSELFKWLALIPLSDTSAGASTIATTSSIPLADSNTLATDGLSFLTSLQLTETAALSSELLVWLASLPLTDSAVFTTTSLETTASIPLTDASTSALDSLAFLTALALAEVGSATSESFQIAVPIAIAESPAGAAEALGFNTLLALSEANSAWIDSLTLGSNLTLTEAGLGADTLAFVVGLSALDTGVSAQTVAVFLPVAITDAGGHLDTLSLLAGAALTETALSSEALDQLAMLSLLEVATASENVALPSTTVVAVPDILSGVDAIVYTPQLTLTDTGAGSEAITPLGQLAVIDVATIAEALDLLIGTGVIDQGSATSTLTLLMLYGIGRDNRRALVFARGAQRANRTGSLYTKRKNPDNHRPR